MTPSAKWKHALPHFRRVIECSFTENSPPFLVFVLVDLALGEALFQNVERISSTRAVMSIRLPRSRTTQPTYEQHCRDDQHYDEAEHQDRAHEPSIPWATPMVVSVIRNAGLLR
jgi:hypothetical protein